MEGGNERYPPRERGQPGYLQDYVVEAPGFGRGRGRGASILAAVNASEVGLQHSNITPVGQQRGVGRGEQLQSLLESITSTNRQSAMENGNVGRVNKMQGFEVHYDDERNERHTIKDSSSEQEESSGESADESEEMIRTLQNRHLQLERDMKVMQEQGKQMEMAMQMLVKKQKEDKKKNRRRTFIPPIHTIPPVLSSTTYPRYPVSSPDSVTPDRNPLPYSRESSKQERHSTDKVLSQRSAHNNSSRGKEASNVSLEELKTVWRRDLKIKGKIGKGGEKENKLDYISVEKQILAAKKKGYQDSDIIEAVIDALPGGSEFRQVLLLKSDTINLEELLDMLKSEYLEIDSSDLIAQLTSAEQSVKEDEQTFLNRLIKLKNRILYEGQEDGVNFSSEAIMGMMLKTLESGLSNERIVTRLLPVFSQRNISDNVLMREMSKAVRSCKGRKEKEVRKCPRVASVEEGKVSKESEEKLVKMMSELKSDVVEVKQVQQRQNVFMKTSMVPQTQMYSQQPQPQQPPPPPQQRQQTPPPPPPQQQQQPQHQGQQQNGFPPTWMLRRRVTFGCQNCMATGNPTQCTHCLKCGDGTHKVKDCPQNQSNSNRSLSRK